MYNVGVKGEVGHPGGGGGRARAFSVTMSASGAAACRAGILVAVLLLSWCGGGRALIDDALDVLRLGKEIGEEVLSSWDVLGRQWNATAGVPLPLMRRRERVVLERLDAVSRAIARLELRLEAGEAAAAATRRGVRFGPRLQPRLADLAALLASVAAAEQKMRLYMRHQQQLERHTLEDFAESCVSNAPGALPGIIDRVHALLVPPHKHLLGQGLFDLVLDATQEPHHDLCDLQMSPHQLIYDMYNTISLTEIKGYAMMQFSWMLLRIYGKGNFTQEARVTRQTFTERTARTAAAAAAALAMARREVYRCDPPHHIEGETYAEVTRLLQGYVENEVEMNTAGTCWEDCGYYTEVEQHCEHDTYCTRQEPCKGKLRHCQYIDSDMLICPASRQSNRRYEWIKYEKGRTLGKPTNSCPRGTTKVDSWWRWLFWHCSYCLCVCDEPGRRSHRYFSLRDAGADVANNKIVTGLRLVKLGRVFHLQIAEGTLGERGSVKPGSWVNVQKYDPADVGLKEGVDYHTLTYSKRAIDLDELESPTGHLLTGVRFKMLGGHLNFEIRATPFNYTTGRLSPERSRWISNDNTDGSEVPRSRLELFRPDVPTRALAPQPVDSQHDQFLEFTHTDLDADAAQTTVPFIDIQPVMPLKGGGLSSGAGIVHRGARGSGGFLAVELVTYDYSKHVAAEPPPAPLPDDPDTTEYTPIVN